MTYVISLANEKGGVAKTTTALSLGAALVEIGKTVLLVDLDPQSNLSLAVGVELDRSTPSIFNTLTTSLPARDLVRETSIPGLELLPSTSDLGQSEYLLPSRHAYESILTKAFQMASWDFDFIILDCPPFMGALTINALVASDLLIIPTQAEFFSVNSLKNMMNMVRLIRSRGNSQLTYRLLLTMYDRRNRIHRSMAEELRTKFQNGVFNTTIEIDTKLRESSIAGLPIIYYAPKCRSAMQYRDLAQEIQRTSTKSAS